ncbi:MAG: DUF1461 domain-containing protein [Thiotrichales bacterium]|nr:DUF1461 domain-containing protein [Thiotrichales bacterium]
MRFITINSLLWSITALFGLLLSLVLAWHILSPVSFFYSQWYDLLAVDENIAEYGPLNRNRIGFETTSRAEHERLMGELVVAINNNGIGFEEINYHDNDGKVIDSLLTAAELAHMRDVSHLVRWMKVCAVGLALLMVALLIALRKASVLMPSLPSLSVKMLGLVAVLVGGVLLIGPVKVFYQLHVWLFPDKNQWFFYYEDSLMTTLLKAPVIFAPIAMVLLLVALVVWWLGFSMIAHFMRPVTVNE